MYKKIPLLTLAFTLFILLILPLIYLIYRNAGVFELGQTVVTTLGVSFFLLSMYWLLSRLNSLLATLVIIGLFLCFFLTRLMLSFVYDFSGRGFTSEFFVHFGWQSFVIALSDYGGVLLIITIVFALFLIMFIKLLNKQSLHSPLISSIIMLASISLIATNLNAVPEWNLLQAYKQYNTPLIESEDIATARTESNSVLRPLRPSQKLPVEKQAIMASTTNQPKNLILIYLESFSDVLTNNQRYPNLTSNLDKLKSEHLSFNNKFSSAYVTIEGIASSQCGTLINMNSGNNALTSSFGRMPNLPCLGDVLKKAGYKQIYYGGADASFAGKKAFLVEHGYDEVRGMKEWKKHGLKAANPWGLSDTDLFNQALNRVLELKKTKQPFNLTLLTLGTHLPGVSYQNCKPYTETDISDPFLDAIHCTDYLVGRFIKQLKQHNILQDTVVYIQGDHPIFPTHGMKRLFLEKYTDTRVFNLVLDQDQDSTLIKTDKASSSMNMVANILESLKIKHNVDFIFAQSDFDATASQSYLLTRYHSFYGVEKEKKLKKPTNCDPFKELSIPLNSCEKKLALNSIYRLNASYSQSKIQKDVCQLGVDISIKPVSNKIHVRWGNKNLSQQFYSKGRLANTSQAGFYLILLDNHDQALSQTFYPSNDPHEINRLLKEVMHEGNRYLLFSNLSTEQLKNIVSPFTVPESFIKQKILYAQYQNGKIKLLNDSSLSLDLTKFIPLSCYAD